MDKNNLPVYCKTDIVVCGGGTAGAFAAIAAAEQGKKVLIVEQYGSIGGTATNALVTPMMKTRIDGEPQCSYIAYKVLERMHAYGGANELGNKFDPLILKIVLEEICVEAGVKFLYHTFIADVIKDDNRIKGIVIANKNGLQVVEADMFIDCTGDGDIGVFAGASYTKGNPETGKCQPISLRYIVGGVDLYAVGDFFKSEVERTGINVAINYDVNSENGIYGAVTGLGKWTLTDLFEQAIANGDLEPDDKFYWQAFNVPGRNDTLAFNNPEFFDYVDGTNPDDLTITQVEGRRRIYKQLQFYKKYMKGFENAYISEIAPMVGIRETRNIDTEYILTAEDLICQHKFEDAICQSNYPVDIHGRALDFSDYAKPVDDGKPYYEIPYRSLVVKGIDNLFVAGRCLGAEFLAQSSLRIQVCCRATGEAAGIAATMAIDKKVLPREVDGKEVRAEMEKRGAVFAK
jgi:hypothetical protein